MKSTTAAGWLIVFAVILGAFLFFRAAVYDKNVDYLSVAAADAINRHYLLGDSGHSASMSHRLKRCRGVDLEKIPSVDVYESCSVALPFSPLSECFLWWLYRRCVGVKLDIRVHSEWDDDELRDVLCAHYHRGQALCEFASSIGAQVIVLPIDRKT